MQRRRWLSADIQVANGSNQDAFDGAKRSSALAKSASAATATQASGAEQQPEKKSRKAGASNRAKRVLLSAERRQAIQRVFRRRQLTAMKLHKHLLDAAEGEADPVAVEQVM